MGLNDSFSAVRAQILLTDPLPSLNKVFALIIQEERHREITVSSLSHESAALMTKSILNSSPTSPHKFTALMTKSTSGPRFAKPPYRKDRPICSHCGVSGHIVEKCYKVHGYPPGFKLTRNKPVSYSANQVQLQGADLNSPHSPQLRNPFQMSNSSQLINSPQMSNSPQLSSPQLSMISNQC